MVLLNIPDNLKTGIKEIDRQHMTLFMMIDNLYSVIATENESMELENILNFLESYVDIHFKTEESYMLKFNYPGYDNHKKHHDDFRQQVNELVKKFRITENKIFINEDLIDILKSWIVNHIEKVDISLAKFLVNQT